MELHQLRSFCVVAEELHITRAARRLRITQPALTRQIKALEKSLHVALIRRVGRAIELTDAGITFYQDSLPILEKLRASIVLTREAARGRVGHITIGLCGCAAFFPEIAASIRQFRIDWPSIGISFVQERTPDLIIALEKQRVDVAFIRPLAHGMNNIKREMLFSEEIFVALPEKHRLSLQPTVTLADLIEEPLIVVSEARELKFSIELARGGEGVGFAPHVAQESPDLLTSVNLVAAGLGITFVPRCLKCIRVPGVSFVSLAAPSRLVDEIVLISRAKDTSVRIAHFVDAVRRVTKSKKSSLADVPGQAGPEEKIT